MVSQVLYDVKLVFLFLPPNILEAYLRLCVGAGEPGNEDGYVVKMTDGDPSPPYRVEPGTRVRLVSDYSAAERRLGEHPSHMHLMLGLGCWGMPGSWLSLARLL